MHTDTYTFDKNTYQNARNFDPNANTEYAKRYQADYQKNHPEVAQKKSSTGKSSTYTVRKGDSLSKIASRTGVSVKQLCKINGLKTTTKIQPGQRLKLR